MRKRRFLLLSALLMALNVALWIVPQGLALQQSVVSALFGKSMMRAVVDESTGCPTSCVEWRIDRGTVVSDALGVLTLQEADGKAQPIPVSSSTKLTGSGSAVGVNGLKHGWRVLVTWPAPNGPATTVVIEKRGKSS